MTVMRISKTKNYVVLHKGALEDPNLSFKAKGLWAYCMSRQDNWEFHVSHLVTVSKDGEDAVYSAIKELKKFGYIKKIQLNEKGCFKKVDYEIRETPYIIKKILPQPDFPDAENPHAENPALISNDSLISNDLEAPPIDPPLRGGEAPPLGAQASPSAPALSKPSKRKKLKEEFVSREDRVSTTPSQHAHLLKQAQGDESLVTKWYAMLSAWKLSKQIEGGSGDYRAITSWVVDAFEKKTSQNNSLSSKKDPGLNDAQQKSFDENSEFVEQLKLEMPDKRMTIWYKNHVFKCQDPDPAKSFDISMLCDPKDFRGYVARKLNIYVHEEADEIYV
jgi:hypothetical protein